MTDPEYEFRSRFVDTARKAIEEGIDEAHRLIERENAELRLENKRLMERNNALVGKMREMHQYVRELQRECGV